jgi:hypothetical protein
MTQVLRWLAPGEIETDISERVDNGSDPRFSVTTYAEECSIASSAITVRDPDGDLHIVGLNRFDILEEDSIADDPYIWVGRFTERVEKRGRYLTGASRDIECTLEDLNNTVSRYIIGLTEDASRPSEDHADRIAWLLTTEACALLTDTSLVLTTTAVTMPAYDYTGMSPQQVIDDCARASGYQNFVWYNGVTDELGLVYALSGGEWLDSTLRLSNVISEVDDSTTFYLGAEGQLSWDPSRIASHVFARGDGVTTFGENDATADLYGRTDKAMDFPTVRSSTTLSDRVDRSLVNDLDTETTTVMGTVYLPSTHASMFKAGYRFELHATHLTGFQEEFAALRLLMTQHELLTPTVYKIEWEAEPMSTGGSGELGCENDLNEPYGTMTYDADSTNPYGAPGPANGTPALINDGDDSTRTGHSIGYAGPPSTMIYRSDLGSSRMVTGFVLLEDMETATDPETPGFITYQFSDDASSWSDCDVTFVSKEVVVATGWRSFWSVDTPSSHRYWRVVFTTNPGGGYHALGWVYTWCIVGDGA